MRGCTSVLTAVSLVLLALLPLLAAPSGALVTAPGPVALASGGGSFVQPSLCSSPATFVVEVGQGVGSVRWVTPDCPDLTGSANFVLVCDTDCDLPPYCAGTPVLQRCEYRLEGTTQGMMLVLERDGSFRFHADLPYANIRASGELTVHAWPVA